MGVTSVLRLRRVTGGHLVSGWSEVVRVDEGGLEVIGEGQAFEAFALTNGD